MISNIYIFLSYTTINIHTFKCYKLLATLKCVNINCCIRQEYIYILLILLHSGMASIKCIFDRLNRFVLIRLLSFTIFNAQLLYSLTICMLHYNPRHVSSINMPIFRRTNFIITTSGIVTLCKRLYSMPVG